MIMCYMVLLIDKSWNSDVILLDHRVLVNLFYIMLLVDKDSHCVVNALKRRELVIVFFHGIVR